MIRIVKGKEPRELLRYRKIKGSKYSGLNNTPVRIAILKEQGYLCAYCMQRIELRNCKIEHFKPQSKYPKIALDYSNLLGVCMGNVGGIEHCDSSKKDLEIEYNPSSKHINIELYIHYGKNGEIVNSNESMEKQIDILNLNLLRLKLNRKAAYDSAKKRIAKLGDAKAAYVQVFNEYSEISNNKLPPYAGIVRYLLKNQISNWR